MTDNYQPWTWKIPECDENMKSKMIPRQDAHERVSGKAVYTRDIYLPGMLYAKILTSPYAHAKVVSMDTSKAEALIGVRDILKYDEPDVANENNTGTSPSNILALPGISSDVQFPQIFESKAQNSRSLFLSTGFFDFRL